MEPLECIADEFAPLGIGSAADIADESLDKLLVVDGLVHEYEACVENVLVVLLVHDGVHDEDEVRLEEGEDALEGVN